MPNWFYGLFALKFVWSENGFEFELGYFWLVLCTAILVALIWF